MVAAGLMTWAGCDSAGTAPETEVDQDPGSEAQTSASSFDVRLTDAPGDVTQAIVTIQRVSVVSVEDTAEGGAEEGGVELLADSSFSADLVELQAGVDTALAQTDSLPGGTYGQIRLVTADTADVLYETAEGDTARARLKQPSASETGIKINFNPVTLDDSTDQARITLDFSVQDSFVKAGESGMYIFKPVIRADTVVTE